MSCGDSLASLALAALIAAVVAACCRIAPADPDPFWDDESAARPPAPAGADGDIDPDDPRVW